MTKYFFFLRERAKYFMSMVATNSVSAPAAESLATPLNQRVNIATTLDQRVNIATAMDKELI